MQKIRYPDRQRWPDLVKRPVLDTRKLGNLAEEIFGKVEQHGDNAVRTYSMLYDHVQCKALRVAEAAYTNAAGRLSSGLRAAIQLAADNIRRFHESQRELVRPVETMPGVCCWRESRAIDTVGLYVPGGSAPLFSTVLMLGIPANLAGCRQVILCTPPDAIGSIHPAVLYAARLAGISAVFAIGGMQAIAAMSIGTASVPRVDKILGPGNQYVTAAKLYAQQRGTTIDLPAGPSEVLVIADAQCQPGFVAADLLSQAEHGPDSQVILLSDEEQVTDLVLKAISEQVSALPRRDIALQALGNSKALLLPTLADCISFSNLYAPEHLILALQDARNYVPQVLSAGSVFLGNYSCESAGDYASGTNHTLPTNGHARSHSGVSLDSFLKKITFQELSSEGIKNIGPAIELMAEAEQLYAHKNAVTLRLNSLR